jgi:hypothetical protein
VELINNKRKDIPSDPSDVYSCMCYIIPAAVAVPSAIAQEDITSLDKHAISFLMIFDIDRGGSSTASSSARNETTIEPHQETNDNNQH